MKGRTKKKLVEPQIPLVFVKKGCSSRRGEFISVGEGKKKER